jgi:hypothetical protein
MARSHAGCLRVVRALIPNKYALIAICRSSCIQMGNFGSSFAKNVASSPLENEPSNLAARHNVAAANPRVWVIQFRSGMLARLAAERWAVLVSAIRLAVTRNAIWRSHESSVLIPGSFGNADRNCEQPSIVRMATDEELWKPFVVY